MEAIEKKEKKVALVTGATGGIGAAVTKHLVQRGYTVIACARNAERLSILREAAPRHVLPVQMDVCDSQSMWLQYLVDCFAFYKDAGLESSRIDALVCCHGASPVSKPTISLSMAGDVIPVLMTDIGGTFLAAQATASYMIRQGGGSMVFVSSLHAHQTYPARVPYAAAKAAVCAMARSMALEWGPHGIRVNTVLPWQVDGGRTTRIAHATEQETGVDVIEHYKRRSPLRALIQEDDVAKSVLFLLENGSANGMEMILDGGVSASMWYQPYLGG